MPRSPYKQQRLFAPLGMMRQPHQMSPMQFANSPRTMWHGSDEEDFEELRGGRGDIEFDDDYQDQGFHVGTVGAAEDRLNNRQSYTDRRGFFHPVRIDSPMMNDPSKPIKDKGEDWNESDFGHYYKNSYEDPGSISAIVEDPYEVTHYADFVHEALDRGGIPSGAAEYHATQLDPASGHTQHSPGFNRKDIDVHTGPETVDYSGAFPQRLGGPSRAEYREPHITQFERGEYSGRQHHDRPMFEEKQNYDEGGWPTSTQLGPRLDAVPPENRSMVETQDEERRKPWLMRQIREASGIEEVLK